MTDSILLAYNLPETIEHQPELKPTVKKACGQIVPTRLLNGGHRLVSFSSRLSQGLVDCVLHDFEELEAKSEQDIFEAVALGRLKASFDHTAERP